MTARGYIPNTATDVKALEPHYGNASALAITGTAEQSLFPSASAGTRTIPAGWFQPGAYAIVSIRGTLTTILTPGSATFRVKLNGTPIVTASGSALLSLASNAGYVCIFSVQCYTAGNNGTIAIGGETRYNTGLLGGVTSIPLNTTSAATVDTTQPITIDATAQFTVGSNAINISTAWVQLMPTA